MRSEFKAVLALAGLAAGCAEQPAGAAGEAPRGKEVPAMEQGSDGKDGVSGLPSSFGRSFATLDQYLDHLRRHAGPIDQPWYREIRPGVYEYVTTMRPAGEPRTYTRAQLMEMFGFTR